MRWSIGLLIAWAALLGASSVQQALPASFWFAPGATLVESARAGECPRMVFDREIKRPFQADWVVTILRERRDGQGFRTYVTYTGENDYRPENQLPIDLDLCWWTWQTSLDLPPGRYRVNTIWTLHLTGGGVREVRRTSNTFQILPQPSKGEIP